jgi:multiple sugar transport system permease protein
VEYIMSRRGRRGEMWLINGALIAASLIALFPLLWMISVSLMASGESSTAPAPLVPADPTLASYRELFTRADVARNLVNSLGLALAATALSLAFNVTAGYAFAKLKFRGRELIWKLLLGVMLVPAQVAMIPLFLMLKQVGLVNTYVGVLVPGLANVFGIFLVRQYARAIPDELLEAARIDGAGELRIFWAIVLPVLRPVLVTLAIFAFLGSWNDFLWPLIVLSRKEHYTLQVGLNAFSGELNVQWHYVLAMTVLSILPVAVIFLFLQRYITAGIANTGLK